MYKSQEDKLSETVIGVAVLLLLKEKKTISVDAVYETLQNHLVAESDELRRSAIIIALWDLHSLRGNPQHNKEAVIRH